MQTGTIPGRPLDVTWADTGADMAPEGSPDNAANRVPILQHRTLRRYVLWMGEGTLRSCDQRRAAAIVQGHNVALLQRSHVLR